MNTKQPGKMSRPQRACPRWTTLDISRSMPEPGLMSKLFNIMMLPIICGSLSTATTFAAEDQWFEVNSQHFKIISDSNRTKTVNFIKELEKFHETFKSITGLKSNSDFFTKLTVFAWSNSSDYTRVMDAKGTAGFFANRIEGPLAYLSLEPSRNMWESDGKQTLFHEYTHHLLRFFGRHEYPLWYNEGIAEYFSTVKFDKKNIILGELVGNRARILENRRWLPYKNILKAHDHYIEGSINGIQNVIKQYSQGWLLTHYLTSDRELAPKLAVYFSKIAKDPEKADSLFKQIIGWELDEIDKRMREYWEKRKLRIMSFPLSSDLQDIDVSVRPIPDEETWVIEKEARFLAYSFRRFFGEYRRTFQDAISAGIRPADMHRYLCIIALSEKSFGKVKAHIEALRKLLPPQSPIPDYYEARMVWAQVDSPDHDGGVERDALREVRSLLRRAIRKDNTYVPALTLLGHTYLHAEDTVPEIAFRVFESADALRPGMVNINIDYAKLRLKNGDYDWAEAIVKQLLSWHSRRVNRDELTEFLQKIRERRETAGLESGGEE